MKKFHAANITFQMNASLKLSELSTRNNCASEIVVREQVPDNRLIRPADDVITLYFEIVADNLDIYA